MVLHDVFMLDWKYRILTILNRGLKCNAKFTVMVYMYAVVIILEVCLMKVVKCFTKSYFQSNNVVLVMQFSWRWRTCWFSCCSCLTFTLHVVLVMETVFFRFLLWLKSQIWKVSLICRMNSISSYVICCCPYIFCVYDYICSVHSFTACALQCI